MKLDGRLGGPDGLSAKLQATLSVGTRRHVVLGMKHDVSATVDAMTMRKYGDMRRGRLDGLRGELLVNNVRRRKDEAKKSGEWRRIGKLEGRNVVVYAKNKKLQLQPLLWSRKKKRCDEPQDESLSLIHI